MKQLPQLNRLWIAILRVIVGSYWLYFSSQKWFNTSWVKPILDESARTNPIPLVRNLISTLVISNWQAITAIQTILEATIGLLLLVGLLTRVAGILGALLATTLLVCFSGFADIALVFWFYLLSATASLTVAISDAGKTVGLDGLIAKKWPNSRIRLW